MSMQLGNRLSALRKEKGISQEELANELGVSRQAVSKWECGESEPETANLIALAKIYNVTLDELVNGETTSPVVEATVVEEKTVNDLDDDDDDIDDDADVKPGQRRSSMSQLQKVIGSVGLFLALAAYLVCGFAWKGPTGNLGWASMWVLFFVPGIIMSLFAAIEARKPSHFQMGLLVIAVYCCMGIIGHAHEVNLWHPWWALFFIIPFYHMITGLIESKKR